MKSVFKTLRFRDGLVWTVGLTAAFLNFRWRTVDRLMVGQGSSPRDTLKWGTFLRLRSVRTGNVRSGEVLYREHGN